MRRILRLAGWQVTTGRPGPEDWVGLWGASPTAWRGEAVARRTGARILRIEDAFLRSIHPGRSRELSAGLLLDEVGVHFDGNRPSQMERTLAEAPLDDTALLDRARACIDRLKRFDLSKYNAFDPDLEAPAPGYVLVLDQTVGDASVRLGGATSTTFREMLTTARVDHPGARIVLRAHPATASGRRKGHFGPQDADDRVEFSTAPVSPWRLLDGAVAVYTVSSQMGFEAILAGHRPRVFGRPFYAGWGLSTDENPPPRRNRRLTRAQLFAAAMMLRPVWYDAFRDRLCSLEDAIEGLEARVRAYREDRHGYVATGIRLWKRPHMRRFFGAHGRLRFLNPPAKATARAGETPVLAWAGNGPDGPHFRVEDGFLRSRGLGAELVPPLSLVRDDLGIYYDPGRESRLERIIAQTRLTAGERDRAERLHRRLRGAALSKYNTGSATLPALPEGRRILVPGQVEDDSSIRLGCGEIRTNRALLAVTRAANPDAILLYKPHPDVEAGLRPGAIPPSEAVLLADAVLEGIDPAAAIEVAEEVWTLTSLIGFEALLRQRRVTCLGTPFYAGWGLTHDRGPAPARRTARPDLATLIHAALIAYPRYHDPVTDLPCPPEVIVDRLETGHALRRGPANRLLSKLQGLMASRATFWR